MLKLFVISYKVHIKIICEAYIVTIYGNYVLAMCNYFYCDTIKNCFITLICCFNSIICYRIIFRYAKIPILTFKYPFLSKWFKFADFPVYIIYFF